MGSKTKTYRDFSASRMFEDEDNLYIKEIIRIYAQTKSIAPQDIMPVVLEDANKFFREDIFKKMGSTIEINFTSGVITDEGILNVVKQYDNTATVIDSYFIKDGNGLAVNSDILKAKTYLDDRYSSSTLCSTEGYQIFDCCTVSVEYPTYNVDGTQCTLNVVNGIPTRSHDDDTGDDGYLMDILDTTTTDDDCDTNGTLIVNIPMGYVNERSVVAVKYNGNKSMFIYEDEIVRSTEVYTGFMLVMRKDKQNVDPKGSKEARFMYARFGLNAEDRDGNSLEDQLDQPDLKDAFLTYATNREDDMFGKYINQLYGGDLSLPGNLVKIEGELNFQYEQVSSPNYDDPYGDETSEYSIKYSGGTFPADVRDEDTNELDNTYIIPFDIIDTTVLRDKFTIYNRMFTMIAYSEKKVKVKWYQTVFFRFLLMVIALIFVGPIAIVMNVVSQVLSMIDPRLGAILGLAFGIISGSIGSGLTGALNLANNILSIVGTFNTVAFQDSIEAIQNEIDKLTSETKEDKEALAETYDDMIYIPFGEKYDHLYDSNFELAMMTPELNEMSIDPELYTNVDKYYKTF